MIGERSARSEERRERIKVKGNERRARRKATRKGSLVIGQVSSWREKTAAYQPPLYPA